jgi:energy-coupling factor transporter ATP-binding protein EcfA2
MNSGSQAIRGERMIDHLQLRFGSAPGEPPLTFAPTQITIFVGPNYSGKSKAISEIASYAYTGSVQPASLILDKLSFRPFPSDEIERIRKRLDRNFGSERESLNEVEDPIVEIGTRGIAGNHRIQLSAFTRALREPQMHACEFAAWYLSPLVLVLDGKSRMNLVNDQAAGDLQTPPISSFQKLFRDDDVRAQLSEIVHRSLGSYLIVDPTNMGMLRLRLSKERPRSAEIERGLSDASVQFHGEGVPIGDASDGAKAFVGILAELMAGDPEVLLMDEPEAFLHPALAFNLGREIARSLAAVERKQLFVSTHSPDFVMGCIHSGIPINVVRLTYRDEVPTARLLPSQELVELMRKPLLRSVGVISALFYESVVVTEGDTDRAFYQEVNERLRVEVGDGIPNCIFLNAQNKQTIPLIVSPLRRLGIPTAAIYDVDMLGDGGKDATRYLQSAGIPNLSLPGYAAQRSAVVAALKAVDHMYKRHGGIELLSQEERAGASNYLDQLEAFGVFVVRGGEVESWLPELGISGHAGEWLIPMFERMGDDPQRAGYVFPAAGDVWEFVRRVARWLKDPSRKGIPTSDTASVAWGDVAPEPSG